MERMQLERYSGVILGQSGTLRSVHREEIRQERHMNSFLLGRFCLPGPSGKVISEWPVMPGYPQTHAPGLVHRYKCP